MRTIRYAAVGLLAALVAPPAATAAPIWDHLIAQGGNLLRDQETLFNHFEGEVRGLASHLRRHGGHKRSAAVVAAEAVLVENRRAVRRLGLEREDQRVALFRAPVVRTGIPGSTVRRFRDLPTVADQTVASLPNARPAEPVSIRGMVGQPRVAAETLAGPDPAPVPEPTALVTLLTAAAGLALRRSRTRSVPARPSVHSNHSRASVPSFVGSAVADLFPAPNRRGPQQRTLHGQVGKLQAAGRQSLARVSLVTIFS